MSSRALRARLAIVLAATILASVASAQQAPTLENARVLYDAGRLDQARAMLEGLTRMSVDDPGVYLLLGVIERTMGDLPEAIASLERAHALAPGSDQPTVELATTLAWHDDLDRAVRLFREVLERDPSNLGARVGLGFSLAWQGHLEKARSLFRDLVGSSPLSIDAWNGLGFVDRAALRRAEAEADYRKALELDPQNKDATSGLKELQWDRRADVRVLGGGSVVPGGAWEPEARMDFTYALGPRATMGGGYQRYAFGAVLPIGGNEPAAGTRSEDSLEASVTLRPSRRVTIGNSFYSFFSNDTNRGMFWEEGVLAVTSRISLIGDFRPVFSSSEPHWLFAGAAGTTVALTQAHRVSIRALIAGDTTYEPRLTLLADYSAAWSRRFQMLIAVAHSSSDERFAFTSVAATASWLMAPSVGLAVIANHRTETFERSEVLFGVLVRR